MREIATSTAARMTASGTRAPPPKWHLLGGLPGGRAQVAPQRWTRLKRRWEERRWEERGPQCPLDPLDFHVRAAGCRQAMTGAERAASLAYDHPADDSLVLGRRAVLLPVPLERLQGQGYGVGRRRSEKEGSGRPVHRGSRGERLGTVGQHPRVGFVRTRWRAVGHGRDGPPLSRVA